MWQQKKRNAHTSSGKVSSQGIKYIRKIRLQFEKNCYASIFLNCTVKKCILLHNVLLPSPPG